MHYLGEKQFISFVEFDRCCFSGFRTVEAQQLRAELMRSRMSEKAAQEKLQEFSRISVSMIFILRHVFEYNLVRALIDYM